MKKLYIFALVAMLFAACTTDETQDVAVNFEAPDTITVSFEDSDDTRIQLNGAQKTVWTKGDLVSVFYKSNANRKWQYQGETGERTGELKQIAMGSATAAMDKVVVAYPYSKNYLLNLTTGDIEATLPATQHYLRDSYGLDGNLMVSSGYFTQFSLKTVCGWLKVQLTGNGEKVRSIKLKGNNGEQVAGLIYVDTTTAACTLASEMGAVGDDGDGVVGGTGGNLAFDGAVVKEVTLDCGDGVTLSSKPTAFYIALPPQTFSKGLTVEVECQHYTKFVKSTNNAVSIQRNAIQPMSAFAFGGELSQQNNEIFYTSSHGKIVTPYSGYENNYATALQTFGANIVSNTYENGMGVITFDAPVTSIGDYAFAVCTSLTSITIPDSVTSIAGNAFLFCTSLTSVTIPDSVTSIGYGAFAYCTSLTSITIPNSITEIGWSAFEGCTSLKAFYGKFATSDNRCLIVNGSLRSFAPAGLTEYVIPNSVTSIGYGAFAQCTSLTSITIPDSVTSIGDYAFAQCTSLTSITIPDSVTSIGAYTFLNCTSLKEVYCKPTTPPTGGEYMFSYGEYYGDSWVYKPIGCKIYVPAESVYLYEAAQYWSDYTLDLVSYNFETNEQECPYNEIHYTSSDGNIINLDYAYFGSAKIVLNTYENDLGIIKFDKNITEIRAYAFRDCTSLTSVTIPDSITSIGEEAFCGCKSLNAFYGNHVSSDNRCLIVNGVLNSFAPAGLTEYVIPNSVTSIGDYAFAQCTSLTSITIPDSVTEIGESAFRDCTSLKEVYCKPTTPPTGYSNMFYINNVSECLICVPIESFKAYKTADGWNEYTRCIAGYNFATGEVVERPKPTSNEIWYTSYNGDIVRPFHSICDATILTNSCINGLGVIVFDREITSIGESAFRFCGLTSITIPDSVTEIGREAFYKCTSLTSVTIGNGVTEIGYYAFSDCTSLKRVDITDLSAWCKISFNDSSSNPLNNGAKLYLNGSELTDITIPSDITEIKACAFYGCTSLTSVTIPDSVTEIGVSAFRDCTSLKAFYGKYASEDNRCWIVNGKLMLFTPAGLSEYTIPNSVTSIGSGAFSGCTSLTSITIPESVTEIGYHAFSACRGELVINCNIPDAIGIRYFTTDTTIADENGFAIEYYGVFQGSHFTKVIIGNGVTSIGRYAFRYSSELTNVTIPDSITSIGEEAFRGCESLNAFYGSLASPDNRCLILNGVLNSFAPAGLTEYVIPNSVTSIGDGAFDRCTSLTSITIPDSVTEIGVSAFRECTGELVFNCNIPAFKQSPFAGSRFTKVIIGDNVTSIGDNAFAICISLTSITIPDSVTSIGDHAFYGCSSLTSITIPDSVTSIGDYAFMYCESLTAITIPNSVTKIGIQALSYCDSLTSATIGNGITSFGVYAFAYCPSLKAFYGDFASSDNRCIIINGTLVSFAPAGLTQYTIPNSVAGVGNGVFYGCSMLTNITIPNSVTAIGHRAFQECTSLTDITIPGGVTVIGGSTFEKCTSLAKVYCKPTTPPTVNGNMFTNNASGRKIYVPAASVEAYKSAEYWSDYASDIEGYEF